jgi:hypothetical protein
MGKKINEVRRNCCGGSVLLSVNNKPHSLLRCRLLEMLEGLGGAREGGCLKRGGIGGVVKGKACTQTHKQGSKETMVEKV